MFAITWKEIQQNVLMIVTFLVISVSVVLIFNGYLPDVFIEEREMLDTNYAFMLGICMAMIIFGGLMGTEKREEKYHGYEFYKILPITDRDIVFGKFLAVLIYAVFGVLFVLFLNNVLLSSYYSLLVPQAYVFLVSGIALVLVGALYPLAFRYAYSKITIEVMGVYIVTLMFPQATHLILLITGQEQTVEQIFTKLTIPFSLVVLGVCLIIFGLESWWALSYKEKLSLDG